MIPVILFYFLRLCASQGPQEPVYVANLDSQMEVCEDDQSATFVDTSNVQVERYNETIAYMHGDVEFFKDIGSDTMVQIILDKEASGKYELMFSHEIWNLCDEISLGVESDYYKYLKYFGLPEKCPFGVGKYPIKEMILSTEDLPLNSHTVGRYQAYLKLYNIPDMERKEDKTFMFCLYMKLIIEME